MSTNAASCATTRFQSTLPRRERQGGEKGIFGVIIAISIHAPVKGATRDTQERTFRVKFQSTLP